MHISNKHYRYISLFIILCILASCFNIHISAVLTSSTNISNSDFSHDTYTTYTTHISNADSDACTPEMLGRQELTCQSNVLHKSNKFSHTYKLLLYVINIIDSLHIPTYRSQLEHLSKPQKNISTTFIIKYIHSQDGKKKDIHNFLSL